MYLCAFRPTGESLSRRDVFRYVARLNRTGHRIDSIVAGPFAAFGTIRPGATRRMARWRQLIGAGEVRLDHRADVARLARVKTAQSMSDLELVLAALEAVGEACVSTILGDFAFVIWDAHAQKVLAVRDAFGVKPLYQRTVSDLMLFSSEMSPLRYQDAYDVDYLADFMRGSVAPGTRTVWRDIAAVPAGGIVRQRGTLRNVERYWQVDNFQVDGTAGDETSCVQFRELLQEGVETRLTGCDDVWAELSGGLDSSTVVALAASSAEGPMLGGTITVVDSLGDGDERAFSDLVVRRLNIRHVQSARLLGVAG
jgi:asparagine synthase (glutamine-hydrolysing)